VLDNVRALHDVAVEVLVPLVERYEQVGDVRVQGCFIGVELVVDKASQGRAADLQEALAAAVLARGVLVDSSTTTLNIQPSLVMEPAALRAALALVCDAVDEVLGGESR
jgi:4-aminobutyrate aminotransferase-like enzyme